MSDKKRYVWEVHSGWGDGRSSYWATYTVKDRALERAKTVSGHGYIKRDSVTQKHFEALQSEGGQK